MIRGCLVLLGLAYEFGFDSAPQGGNPVEKVTNCWYLQIGERQVNGQAGLAARGNKVRRLSCPALRHGIVE